MTDSLNVALVNVRKAYRLLAEYQQRIIELLAAIQKELSAQDYSHCYKYMPSQKSPWSLASFASDEWAGLRFLPLLGASMLWVRPAEPKEPKNDIWESHAGDILFDIKVNSAEGLDRGKQLPQDWDAEGSKSNLEITAFYCEIPIPGKHLWYDVWRNFDYSEEGGIGTSDKMSGKYRVYRETISLAELIDQESVKQKISDFRQRASQKLGCEICVS
jgi:hypothetical protein